MHYFGYTYVYIISICDIELFYAIFSKINAFRITIHRLWIIIKITYTYIYTHTHIISHNIHTHLIVNSNLNNIKQPFATYCVQGCEIKYQKRERKEKHLDRFCALISLENRFVYGNFIELSKIVYTVNACTLLTHRQNIIYS